ncbi:MAG: MATE family efflux transporter, partial [Caulobacteraceae bacterium]
VRSTGAVWAPMAILVISMIGVRIPFAALMAPRLGEDSIWWSFPLGTITSASLNILYYRFGGWRRARMLDESAHGQAPDAGLGAPAMAEPAAARR